MIFQEAGGTKPPGLVALRATKAHARPGHVCPLEAFWPSRRFNPPCREPPAAVWVACEAVSCSRVASVVIVAKRPARSRPMPLSLNDEEKDLLVALAQPLD